MSDALFDLPQPKTKAPRRVLNQNARLTTKPVLRKCQHCKQTVLSAMSDFGVQEVDTDPINLTASAVQAAHTLNIRVYRAPTTLNGHPTELWLTHPKDPPEKQPWKYLWVAQHNCAALPLPGSRIRIEEPTTETPDEPPY